MRSGCSALYPPLEVLDAPAQEAAVAEPALGQVETVGIPLLPARLAPIADEYVDAVVGTRRISRRSCGAQRWSPRRDRRSRVRCRPSAALPPLPAGHQAGHRPVARLGRSHSGRRGLRRPVAGCPSCSRRSAAGRSCRALSIQTSGGRSASGRARSMARHVSSSIISQTMMAATVDLFPPYETAVASAR